MTGSAEVLLTSFPLFQGFTPHGAQSIIDRGEIRECPAGQILFKEGDTPADVLLVLTGKLQIYLNRGGKDLVLTEAGPGAVVGELAVLCGIPRSASVRAMEPSAVLTWSAQAFRRLLLSEVMLSERIFRQSLRTLIEKEQSLIASLVQSESATGVSRVQA